MTNSTRIILLSSTLLALTWTATGNAQTVALYKDRQGLALYKDRQAAVRTGGSNVSLMKIMRGMR